MTRRKHVDGTTDARWLEEAWGWAVDIEREHAVIVQISLRSTPRRGVWGIQVRAIRFKASEPVILAVVGGEYPTAAATSLGAAMFGMGVRLGRVLDEQRGLHPDGLIVSAPEDD